MFFKSDAKVVPADTMLVDYYCKAEGGGHYELVLYAAEDAAKAKLCVYSKEDETAAEECTEYIVPYKAAERCFELIKDNDLDSWNSMTDYTAIDGALTVCRYYDSGEYIRVSTEQMPHNGREILDSIGAVMAEYAAEDYRTDGKAAQ